MNLLILRLGLGIASHGPFQPLGPSHCPASTRTLNISRLCRSLQPVRPEFPKSKTLTPKPLEALESWNLEPQTLTPSTALNPKPEILPKPKTLRLPSMPCHVRRRPTNLVLYSPAPQPPLSVSHTNTLDPANFRSGGIDSWYILGHESNWRIYGLSWPTRKVS